MSYSILRKLVIAGGLFCWVTIASAQAMQSASYRIQDDSINIGGGYSSSTSYRMQDTVGEVGTGDSSSTNYAVHAGYQQMQESYLALSGATNVTLSPSIGGITGGTSDGSTVLTATTDDYAGYQMTITASTSPAMQSGANTISDYSPSGAAPDFSFSTGAGQARFGFSPEGADIASRYKDNGAACNTGSSDASLSCWDGVSTTPITIATRSSANHPNGTATTIRFRVGIGGSVSQAPGTYTATTTVTLVAL